MHPISASILFIADVGAQGRLLPDHCLHSLTLYGGRVHVDSTLKVDDSIQKIYFMSVPWWTAILLSTERNLYSLHFPRSVIKLHGALLEAAGAPSGRDKGIGLFV